MRRRRMRPMRFAVLAVMIASAVHTSVGDRAESAASLNTTATTGGVPLEKISIDRHGELPDSASDTPVLSRDGTKVAFSSLASDLVPGDTNNAKDVFVQDVGGGPSTRERVNVKGAHPGAEEANGGFNTVVDISDTGRYVAFASNASNLVSGDTNGTTDVFLRDVEAGSTERVSVDDEGNQLTGDSMAPAISGDGRFVAFTSSTNDVGPPLPDDPWTDIFLRDRQTGKTTRITAPAPGSGPTVDGGSGAPDISADGRFVVFHSEASNLIPVPQDTNGTTDVFLFDTQSGVLSKVTPPFGTPGASQGNGPSRGARISADGLLIAFFSSATNLGGAGAPGEDTFAVRTGTAAFELISARNDGLGANNRSPFAPSVSGDGRYVAFATFASDIVANDTNGAVDVMVRDRSLGTTRRVVSSSGQEPNGTSSEPSLSGDGSLIAFTSRATNLSATDDNFNDVFVSGPRAPDLRPLIMIPGITGTFLRDALGSEAWPQVGKTLSDGDDDHLDVLRLASDGASPAAPDDPRQPVSVSVGQGFSGVIDAIGPKEAYQPFRTFMVGHGYVPDETLFFFGVDWRLAPAWNAQRLLEKIDSVLGATGVNQVDLVAHSQGGLITMAALADERAAGKVHRVVTLGTPFLGTPKFFAVLDYAAPCQMPLPVFEYVCLLDEGQAQGLTTNWSGALALMPSRAYFQAAPRGHTPLRMLWDENGDGRPEGFRDFDYVRSRLSDRNLVLLDEQWAFHDNIDRWFPADPAVRLLRVVGTGLGTLATVTEFLAPLCPGSSWWSCTERPGVAFRLDDRSGDGTVIWSSAAVWNPDRGFDYRGFGFNLFARHVGHSELTSDERVLTDVLLYLNEQYSGAPPQALASATASEGPTFLEDAPSPLDQTKISTFGPAAGGVVDESGRLAGYRPDGSPDVQDLPGAGFLAAPGFQSVGLTETGTYSGTWTATAVGEVGFTLSEVTDDEVTAVRSIRTQVQSGAVMRMTFARPLAGMLALTIDDDGDGDADRTLQFPDPVTGAAASDVEPPTTSVRVEALPAGTAGSRVRVVVDSSDAGGSGIARVQYGVEGSTVAGDYSSPLYLPADGRLVVRAIDRAGNVQAPYTVVDLSGATTPLTCTILGTPGDDNLTGTPGDDVICAGAGNDVVDAGAGHDLVLGGDGVDSINGQAGSDTLYGGRQHDVLRSGSVNDAFSDYLFGEEGADTLLAIDRIAANDELDGGPGGDVCLSDAGDTKWACDAAV